MRSSLLALLASAAFVSAQRCDDDKVTINSDGDLKAYADSCTTLSGSVTIGKGVKQADFGSISTIKGDLIADGATDCTSMSGSKLGQIGGLFQLRSMTVLQTINFPSLQAVGDLEFQTLPACSQLGFTREITKARSVKISDTVLTTLKGINIENCDTFDINNNRYLKEVSVKLQTVSNALGITFNAKSVQVSLPNLQWSNNLTFRDVGSVKTPSLSTVNGSIGFINCTFDSYAAPNLTNVGEALAFVDCNNLQNASFPQLTEVKGTLLFANSSIKDITGFPKLDTVQGAVDMSGKMEKVDLPALKDVRGGYNVQTSADIDCSTSDKESSDGTIKGTYLCTGKVKDGDQGGLGTDPSTGSKSSKSKSAAGQVAISITSAVACAVFSIVYAL